MTSSPRDSKVRTFNIQTVDPRDGSIRSRAVPLIARCRLYVSNVAYEFAVHENPRGAVYPPTLAHYYTGIRLCDLAVGASYLSTAKAPTVKERASAALNALIARTSAERVAQALKRAENPSSECAPQHPRLNGGTPGARRHKNTNTSPLKSA